MRRHHEARGCGASPSSMHPLHVAVCIRSCVWHARGMPRRLRRLTLERTDVTHVGVAALGALAGTLAHLDLSRTSFRGDEWSYAALRQCGLRATPPTLGCPISRPPAR